MILFPWPNAKICQIRYRREMVWIRLLVVEDTHDTFYRSFARIYELLGNCMSNSSLSLELSIVIFHFFFKFDFSCFLECLDFLCNEKDDSCEKKDANTERLIVPWLPAFTGYFKQAILPFPMSSPFVHCCACCMLEFLSQKMIPLWLKQ